MEASQIYDLPYIKSMTQSCAMMQSTTASMAVQGQSRMVFASTSFNAQVNKLRSNPVATSTLVVTKFRSG